MKKNQKKVVNTIKPQASVKDVVAKAAAINSLMKSQIASQLKTEMKVEQKSANKRRAVGVMKKALPGKVDNLGAEEQALKTAMATIHPELVADARQVDEVSTPTGTMKTIQRYAGSTIANGAAYEYMLVATPFMNDQLVVTNTYAAGVCSAIAYVDNPTFTAVTGVYSHVRLVSMSVEVVNTAPSLSLNGVWVAGCGRTSLLSLNGFNFNTYQTVKNFSKGQFSADSDGNSFRMIWLQADPADGWFYAQNDTPGSSTAAQRTSILVAFQTNTAQTFEIVVTCQFEGIVSLNSQQFIPTAAVAADPAVKARAITAAGENFAMNPESVTNPVKAASSSHTNLASMAKAAVGVVGDLATGDLAGAAKGIISNLGNIGDVVEDGFSFLADGIGSLFGFSPIAEQMFRTALIVNDLGEDEIKDMLDVYLKLEKSGALPKGLFSTFFIALREAKISVDYDRFQRIPQPTGITRYDGRDVITTKVDNPSVFSLSVPSRLRLPGTFALSAPLTKPRS